MSDISSATTWTRERVYTALANDADRSQWPPYLDQESAEQMRDSRTHWVYDTWTAEFCEAIGSEESWQLTTSVPAPSAATVKSIMAGQPCPVCHSTVGGEVKAIHRGERTNIELIMPVRCPCGVVVRFRDAWAKQMKAHARFADVRLTDIKPHAQLALDMETQAKIITEIKTAPSDSYFLTGRPGTGKSHLMTALFRRALSNWAVKSWSENVYRPAVWRISAAQLLDQHVAWATRNPGEGKVPPPTVQVSAIHAAAEDGFRPCLFLDELDKIGATDFKLQKLIAIVDAVYEAEGQLCATSNKARRSWSPSGEWTERAHSSDASAEDPERTLSISAMGKRGTAIRGGINPCEVLNYRTSR